jgi:hypothetical protein
VEQDAWTEEHVTLFGGPFMDLDEKSVVENAAQRARTVAAVMTAAAGSADAEEGIDSSSVGRRPNVDRGFDKGFAHLASDYFGVNPTYEAAKFARRFPRPQSVFNRIYTALSVRPGLVRKADALGVFGLHPL